MVTSSMTSTQLETACGLLSLATPFMNASGTFRPETFAPLFSIKHCMGAVVSKTVTPLAQPGNAQQRTVEIPALGMLNSIGLQGKGIAFFLQQQLAELASHGAPVIVSLSASTPEAFAEMLQLCQRQPVPIAAIELNLSCPNVKEGGVNAGSSLEWIEAVVSAARSACDYPLFAKLTPNIGDIVPLAEQALHAGATGLTAINTVLGMHIDTRRRLPSLNRKWGGYSGPAIRPIALYHVFRIAEAFPGVPLLGVGGIQRLNDVLEFLMAGCQGVQLGTVCFQQPGLYGVLCQQLSEWMEKEGVTELASIIGCAHTR